MISDLYKLVKLAFSSTMPEERAGCCSSMRNAPERLLGRGSLAVSNGYVTTGRDMRILRRSVLAHDFRP